MSSLPGSAMTSTLGPLASLSFGQDVAEHDDRLDTYFLSTGTYWAVVHDEIDVVLGAKGTGKSAIARYIARSDVSIPALQDVLVIPAFNLRGSVLFRRLSEAGPSADEAAYRDLFLAYTACLAANHLLGLYEGAHDMTALSEELDEIGLRVQKREVHSIWRRTLDRLRPRIETTVTFEENKSEPLADPPPPLSLDRIEALLDQIYNFAESVGIRVWILFDRLDEAFAENRTMESAALRGLLRSSLDISSLGKSLRVKLFLRLDIFERITESMGFVNATHLRLKRITWDSDAIHHLVALRLRAWDQRVGFAMPDNALASPIARRRYCRRILPQKVQAHDPLVWLLLVTVDATREYNPRNVITLLRNAQLEEIQIGARNGEDPETRRALLSVRALYSGYRQLSVARLNDTLYAENAVAREYVPRFRGKETTFDLLSLEQRLGISGEELNRVTANLVYAGFLRLDGDHYLLPALYRPALFASTHRAELLIGVEDLPEIDPLKIVDDEGSSGADEVDPTSGTPGAGGVAELQAREPRRRTRGRRRKSDGWGRDEFIPTGAKSEVVDEESFAAQIASELAIDSTERRDHAVSEETVGPNTGQESKDATLSEGGQAVVEARRLGEQGDALGGFRLLFPRFTVHPGAACVASDLAYQSDDQELMCLARNMLAEHEAQGSVLGRSAALAAYVGDDSGVVLVLGQLPRAQMQSFVIGLIRMVSLVPEREAQFWRTLVDSFWRSISVSDMAPIWPVLAASRVLPICRYYWQAGSGAEVGFLGVTGVRDMIWDSHHWASDLPKIITWASRYADDPATAEPALLPYQVLSCAAVLDSVGALSNQVRTRLLQQLSGHVAGADQQHKDRFWNWTQFTPLAMEILEGDYGRKQPRASAGHGTKRSVGRGETRVRPKTTMRSVANTIRSPRATAEDVALLLRVLQHEQAARTEASPQLLLAILGSRVRRLESAFDFKKEGFSTLLAWVTACSEADDRISIARTAQGHPYVWLANTPVVDGL